MDDGSSNISRLTQDGRRAARKLTLEVNTARTYADAAVAGALVTVERLTDDKHMARKVLARAAFDELADATTTEEALRYINIIANVDERDDGPHAA